MTERRLVWAFLPCYLATDQEALIAAMQRLGAPGLSMKVKSLLHEKDASGAGGSTSASR